MTISLDKPKQFSARKVVEIIGNRIHIDESRLDLFHYPEYDLPEWKPTINLKPYAELSQFYVDIETSGLNPDVDKVELIGLYNEKNVAVIINCLAKPINKQLLIDKLNQADTENVKYSGNNLVVINSGSEKLGLQKFVEILTKKNPDLFVTFNGFKFDLPFIIKRCLVNNVKHYFYVNDKRETCHKTAQKWGKPQTYNGIWLTTYPKDKCAIIDLYNQVLAWDFVARKLTSHSLKQSVLQTGLRSEARLELSYEEMRVVVNQGKIEEFAQYLVYDLEDTKLLGDFLIPAIYYQKLFLPDWKLQSISHSGNGSKHNDILKKHYSIKGQSLPGTDQKLLFEGGLTGANAGYYKYVSKIDVASLYPSIMLTYCICSIKDVDKFQLILLKYLLNFRLELKAKKKAKTATNEEIQTEGSFKIMINSMYGSLGTTGIEFNDYVAAALVTAYGRAILKLMVKLIQENGGTVASIDTDGVYYSTNDSTYELNKQIHKIVQSQMPKGINLDYELEAQAFFVPPNDIYNGIKSSVVTGTDEDEDGIRNDGLKKNYIIVDLKGKLKSKGKYVKRDRCKLEKEFQPTLVLKLLESVEAATNYYQDIINQMKLGIYPVENLKITRTIRKGEIKMLSLGSEGEQVSYYFAEPQIVIGKRGKPLKNKQEIRITEGVPGWNFYQDLVTKMFDEVMQFVK
ncbi:hypothetical protein NIES2100_04910 [Calothrix sp. NIES-2100]|uniref:DNA polymerase domain-containing protein n=1 Tax=Calothrix sp. NIES-2100 TaxID=1954172 RepID=UPI000B619FA3|nr:hypothetical protein NIES2100_04910 [Calothrix sp. NIES-2100]